MKLKTIALFAVLFALPASTASAITVAGSQSVASASGSSAIHKVDNRNHNRKKYHKRKHYKAGHRYNKAPSNWNRHHKRPGNWQRRGCIMVGPMWWCP